MQTRHFTMSNLHSTALTRTVAALSDQHSTTPNFGISPNEIRFRFGEYIRRNLFSGRNGREEEAPYVAKSVLESFWQPSDITELLQSVGLHTCLHHLIYDKYLRIFSILVFINRLIYLKRFIYTAFTDAQLYRHVPWHETGHDDFSQEFDDAKWVFLPWELARGNLHQQSLPNKCVLPWEILPYGQDDLCGRTPLNILKVKVNALCNMLDTDTLIVKVFATGSSDREFWRETQAYAKLWKVDPCENLVKYYGSFRQNTIGYLLLEYVKGTNLLNYMKTVKQLGKRRDIYDFWKSVSGVSEAMTTIHKASIIHQDVKPDNILIKTNSQSPYTFIAKLADLGHSALAWNLEEVKRSQDHQTMLRGEDNRGNATYSAPEASHHRRENESAPGEVTSSCDVWAMGVLWLELSAWVVGGHQLVKHLRNIREKELENKDDFSGSGYVQSFHNGEELLPSMEDAFEVLKVERRAAGDVLTADMIDLALENMLCKLPSQRLQAEQLLSAVQNVLKDNRLPDAPAIREP